jgi:propionyl-CoA:succinyl-CoA transferase
MPASRIFPRITADEAARLIQHGQTVGFSGFTPAGAAKAVPLALARRARAEHQSGRDFQIGVLTGASTGRQIDGALAEAAAISFRTPYQSDPVLRNQINTGQTRFFDMHLSLLPQVVRYGFLGPLHWAIVEACDVTEDGEITLTSSVGASPTFLTRADKILIEFNRWHPSRLRGFHDIYEPLDPPRRREVPIYTARDRTGAPYVKVAPQRIVGVIETDLPDEGTAFAEPNEVTQRIGGNVAQFLAAEVASGRIPAEFLPVQSGVGDIANSVLFALGENPGIPPFEMYTEVVQDAVIRLMRKDRVRFASTCALTLSEDLLREVYGDLESYRGRLVMRPQEITNHPEVIRRLGLISMNTAIEVDIFGNVNSTHVMGRQLMNGIGGSGDFTRNAYLSIFSCPSTAKGGKISTIVPLVTHMDHSEHSVQVVATEWGVADLRGRDPMERARLIIDHCAHPDFRDQLHGYLRVVGAGHVPFTLSAAFAFHQQFLRTGDMRNVDWEVYAEVQPA